MEGLKLVEVLTIVALVSGPCVAVSITIWSQRRQEKRNGLNSLFLTLMAYRKTFPPTQEWANALNLIDVVYADHPKVIEKWHEAHANLNRNPVNAQDWMHSYLELLSAMARVLGYKELQQTQIDKFYAPQAFGNQAQMNAEIQAELLRVLKATAAIPVQPRPQR